MKKNGTQDREDGRQYEQKANVSKHNILLIFLEQLFACIYLCGSTGIASNFTQLWRAGVVYILILWSLEEPHQVAHSKIRIPHQADCSGGLNTWPLSFI